MYVKGRASTTIRPGVITAKLAPGAGEPPSPTTPPQNLGQNVETGVVAGAGVLLSGIAQTEDQVDRS